MRIFKLALFVCLLGFIWVSQMSCRGWVSDKPPIHLNPNMDTQPKYKAYRQSNWFGDQRDMRPLVPGVVARGYLKEDDHFYRGKVNGAFSNDFPKSLTINEAFVHRGRNRFNIYCASCHDHAGGGKGLVGARMLIKPMSLHGEYMYYMPKGRLFDIISNGSRSMPAHSLQLVEKDRWAIVAYVKALQISQNADGEW